MISSAVKFAPAVFNSCTPFDSPSILLGVPLRSSFSINLAMLPAILLTTNPTTSKLESLIRLIDTSEIALPRNPVKLIDLNLPVLLSPSVNSSAYSIVMSEVLSS